MRRSPLLQVKVHCPHFERPTVAQWNAAIERLVACEESDRCRGPLPPDADPAAEDRRPFPQGCPVYPTPNR